MKRPGWTLTEPAWLRAVWTYVQRDARLAVATSYSGTIWSPRRAAPVASPSGDWGDVDRISIKKPAWLGIATSIVFIAFFGIWATTVPLAGAVVATGVVAASGRNQKVEHLEGGIVKSILVDEGERVKAGQVLFRLDPTVPLSERNQLELQVVELEARVRRLLSERDGGQTLTFPPDLVARADHDGASRLLAAQRKEFESRLQRWKQEHSILVKQIDALKEQSTGLAAQKQAVKKQLTIVGGEVKRKQALLAKGLTERTEYSSLLRSEADLVGQSAQSNAAVLQANIQIVETEEESAKLDSQRSETAASELNQVRSDLDGARQKLRAANNVLDRLAVRAPTDGIVVHRFFDTPGSVVPPGAVLAEILPTGRKLIVEAHIQPKDIDSVRQGEQATIRLMSLNARLTPTVAARVIYLSADRLVDQQTQKAYYVARLALADHLPRGVSAKDIYPGMPVEVYMKTGSRTFLDYLFRPLLDSLSRAFREQ